MNRDPLPTASFTKNLGVIKQKRQTEGQKSLKRNGFSHNAQLSCCSCKEFVCAKRAKIPTKTSTSTVKDYEHRRIAKSLIHFPISLSSLGNSWPLLRTG